MARKKTQREHQRTQKGQHIVNMTDDQAREHIEKLLWPDGEPICRHCGSVNAYRMQGATCRPGLCRCRDCKKQFTVTVGTIFEDTKIGLATWLRAFHLMCSSKKGISALQLQRNLGLGSYRTAWHMAHRIRLAMRCEPMHSLLTGIVESDESYVGGKPRPAAGKGATRKQGQTTKQPIHVLVERDGRKRTRVMERVTVENLRANRHKQADRSSVLMTDENNKYHAIGPDFAGHKAVDHSKHEYYRKSDGASTNTAESSFSLIKRGVYGTFHHISKKHMQRYLDEFDFRWDHRATVDSDRTTAALKQVEGKRLMYREPVAVKTT